MLQHCITSVCQLGEGTTTTTGGGGGGSSGGFVLWVGDTHGDVYLLDMRKLSMQRYLFAKMLRSGEGMGLGRLVGLGGGAISQLVVHPTLTNVLACVG